MSTAAKVVLGSLGSLLVSMPVLASQEVRVYSGRHYNTDRKVFKNFSDSTGIKVRLLESKGASLVERLRREGSNSTADVILLVDAARINNAANLGLFSPVQSTSLQRDVPARYRDPKNRWFGVTRRVRVMVVNSKIVPMSKLKTYADLGKPFLKGKLCLRRRNNVYNQSLVADQIALRGVEATKTWLKGMRSNINQPYFPGDISLIRAVAQGKCGVGIVNHYYYSRMLAGVNGSGDQSLAKEIRVFIPNPAHVNISAAAVAKNAKNRGNAIKLIEYLASSKGSRQLANPTFEHPISSLNSSPYVSRLGAFTPDSVTISQLSQYQPLAIQLMAASGWR